MLQLRQASAEQCPDQLHPAAAAGAAAVVERDVSHARRGVVRRRCVLLSLSQPAPADGQHHAVGAAAELCLPAPQPRCLPMDYH